MKPIKLFTDLSVHLYEGEAAKKRGTPTPIIFLTQWKLMGNSTVHTDEYLTQWKVSGNSQIQQYLTQWKVEGNSVVDNNAILSCGDLGQDGKYHVKISNGVDVFDIALDEPLRMTNNNADTIEYADNVCTVTRKCGFADLGTLTWTEMTNNRFIARFNLPIMPRANEVYQILNTGGYTSVTGSISKLTTQDKLIAYLTLFISETAQGFIIRDESFSDAQDAKQKLTGIYAVYELETPTTEIIQAPQISVSPTNTYSSANATPYSAFTYANPLIYSCGDYSDVDGKYHVKISNGATIYDIPLTEPLRKVNDVADSIEFANGVATLTRNFAKAPLGDVFWYKQQHSNGKYRYITHGFESLDKPIKPAASNANPANILCPIYDTIAANNAYSATEIGISVEITKGTIYLYDENYNQQGDFDAFQAHIQGVELIYELATPTTEVIQVSPFPVSPTDTYTSANDTPYSSFTHTNKEIWSCGEYSAIDGKYHIVVQPLGKSPIDIALDEPLRKVNDVADSLEFAYGVATVTRNISSAVIGNTNVAKTSTNTPNVWRWALKIGAKVFTTNILNTKYAYNKRTYYCEEGINADSGGDIQIFDSAYTSANDKQAFIAANADVEIIYELATPTTETITVPQIQEADSYSCVISQGAKAVEWSSFETD